MSYKVKLVEKKDPLIQLEASKSNIKDLFNRLLDETEGFKYQITLKVELSKYKSKGKIEFTPVYFNSTIKTVINHEFSLDKSFQKILYMIDNWISKGFCWIFERIKSQYINILTYRPLQGFSSWIKNSKKGIVNIKNNDQKSFLWCHIRHLNPVKIYRERITQKDKELVSNLNYDETEFPVDKKDFSKIEKKNNMY